jgi:hypothetical protein
VISSRGLAHLQSDYQHTVQKTADVIQMVSRGFEVVSKVKRPGFRHNEQYDEAPDVEKPCFNFPLITGRLLNGQNFAPLNENQQVGLFIDGQPMEMYNSNWPNPYTIVSTLPGNFMFLPKPVFAEAPGQKRNFSLTIRLQAEGYNDFSHSFVVDLASDSRILNALKSNRNFRIPDLYIFKTDFTEEGLEP